MSDPSPEGVEDTAVIHVAVDDGDQPGELPKYPRARSLKSISRHYSRISSLRLGGERGSEVSFAEGDGEVLSNKATAIQAVWRSHKVRKDIALIKKRRRSQRVDPATSSGATAGEKEAELEPVAGEFHFLQAKKRVTYRQDTHSKAKLLLNESHVCFNARVLRVWTTTTCCACCVHDQEQLC